MKTIVFSLVSLAFALSSASAADQVNITCQWPQSALRAVGASKEQASRGPAVIALKETATFTLGKEIIFPTDFDPPQKPANISGPATEIPIITPTTPTAFVSDWAGWELKITPRQSGDLITLTGEATRSVHVVTHALHGEMSGPIYADMLGARRTKERILITPNRADTSTVTHTKSHFTVLAKPGKDYEVPLRDGDRTIKVTLRCEHVAPEKTKSADAAVRMSSPSGS